MFNRQIITISLITLPLLLVCLLSITWVTEGDLVRFDEIVKEKKLASSNGQAPTNQKRMGVCKEIWFSQDDASRLHYKISSDASLLSLIPVGNRFEVVEELSGIQCWMQDKLFEDTETHSPMQQSRYIEADGGHYRYTTQEFTANGVTLSLFRLPSHALPIEQPNQESAFLSGIARNISFLFSGKTPQFQAEHFQATMVKE